MIARAAALLGASIVALSLAGCAVVGPTVQTSAVFAAAPWRVGERLEYRLMNTDGQQIGTGVLTVQLGADANHLVLGQVYSGMSTEGAKPTGDTIALTVDAKTLVPTQGARDTSSRDTSGGLVSARTAWSYQSDGDRVRLTTQVEGGAAGSLVVGAQAYDNEASLWLWRGIAFTEGYEQTYASVNPFARTQQEVTLRAPQQGKVTVPAGTYDTWRILLRNGRAVRTAWISIAPPHEVVRWDNGDMLFELVKSEK